MRDGDERRPAFDVEAVRLDPDAVDGGVWSRLGLARAAGQKLAEAGFTYSIFGARRRFDDKRSDPRRRTRLRTGKLVSARSGFLTGCRVYDRARAGARLDLARRVALPDCLTLFEDETGLLLAIRPVWRGPDRIGVVIELAHDDPRGAAFGRSHYGLR